MSFRGEKRPSVSQEMPVLCKFWQEDGVWNGSAQDLPVAVFGETIELLRIFSMEAALEACL